MYATVLFSEDDLQLKVMVIEQDFNLLRYLINGDFDRTS